jgi:S-adenosylmethionine decarboxylase
MNNNIVSAAEFDNAAGWGLWAGVDLHACDIATITDAERVKQFVYELCDRIEMRRFGECVVVDFGDDPKVSGFSMTQLIETSLISAHFVNQNGNVYLDIFSCKYYDAQEAAQFAAEYFSAKDFTVRSVIRK